MIQALEWQELMKKEGLTCAVLARRLGVSRVRVTQVLALLRLAPKIQESLLTLHKSGNRRIVTERLLRRITHITDPRTQVAQFEALLRCVRRTD